MGSRDNNSHAGRHGSKDREHSSSFPYNRGTERRVRHGDRRRGGSRESSAQRRERREKQMRKEILSEIQRSNDVWRDQEQWKLEQQLHVEFEWKQKNFIDDMETKLETRYQEAYDVEFTKLKEDYDRQLTQRNVEWDECDVINQRYYDSRKADLEDKYIEIMAQQKVEHEQSFEIQNDSFKKSLAQVQAKCDETVRQIRGDFAARLQPYEKQNQPPPTRDLEHTFQDFQSQQIAKEKTLHQKLNIEWRAMCHRRNRRLVDGKIVFGNINYPESHVRQILEVLRRCLLQDEMLSCYITEQWPELEHTRYRPEINTRLEFQSTHRQLEAQRPVSFKPACEAARAGLMDERDDIWCGIMTHPLYRRKEEKKQVALLQACVLFFDVCFTNHVLELTRRSTQPASPLRLGGSIWTAKIADVDVGDYDAEKLSKMNWDIWTKGML